MQRVEAAKAELLKSPALARIEEAKAEAAARIGAAKAELRQAEAQRAPTKRGRGRPRKDL